MNEILSGLFKGKNEKKVVYKLKICCSDLSLIINDDNTRINMEVITIKKIKMHIEFIDGTPEDFPEDLTFEGKECSDGFPQKFTFEGKNSYIHKKDGYHISLNKLGEEFRDDADWRFQEKLFIPHTSIKMVREQIEYHVEKRDVFNLIKRYSKPDKAITYAKIKEKLEANGVKFSRESLEAILERLEDESKIHKPIHIIDAWVTKETRARAINIDAEEEKQELNEPFLKENFQ